MNKASRLDCVSASMIRAMNENAPRDAIQLGLGEPSWGLPPGVVAKALAAMGKAFGNGLPCSYGPNAGIPELRAAIRDLVGADEDELLVSAGSQAALFALFQAWLGPGDRVLVPDPGFLAYPALARLAGADPVPYSLGRNAELDADLVETALKEYQGTKAMIINHPSNPTGGGATRDALSAVARLCEDRGMLLVSDEVYRELYITERPASLHDESGYGVVISSISKAWGSPGLRVGWAVGSPEILGPARLVHNYMTSCAARPSQLAATALIESSAEVIPAAREELRSRWEVFASACRKHLGIEAIPPAGSFYYWMRLPMLAREDPLAFCLKLRDECGVIVIPGIAFGEGGRDFARVSFAALPRDIAEGIKRMANFWRTA